MRRLVPASALMVALTACSGASSLGGLTKNGKSDDKSTASDKSADPAETAAEDQDEDSFADKPVQVSGAFLTAVCGAAARLATEPVPAAGQSVFGCAVIDDKGARTTSRPVTVQSVRVRLATDEAVTPTPVATPAGSGWDVLFTLPTAQWETAKRVVLAATVDGKAVTLADAKPREHEGCGKGEVFNRSDRACLGLVKLVRWYNPTRADYVLMPVTAAVPGGWEIQADDADSAVYVAPPRACSGGCTLADDPRYIGIERHFGPPGTNVHVQCVEGSQECDDAARINQMASEGVDFRGFAPDAFPGLVRMRRWSNTGDATHFYSSTGKDVPAGYADESGEGALFHAFRTLP